jgi:AraC-like DNA-binding protein
VIEPFEFRAEDPDALSEGVQRFAPGVRIRGVEANESRGRIRAWLLPHMNILSVRLQGSSVELPENRDFFGFTLPLRGALDIQQGIRVDTIDRRSAHFLTCGESVVFRPRRHSQIIAVNIDASLAARCGQREARAGGAPGSRLIDEKEVAYSCIEFSKWIYQEIEREESALREPRAALEVEGALSALIAQLIPPAPESGARVADGALRRAEEILDAQVEGAISLPQLAAEVGCSVRTLTRQFRAQHGVGPMGFLRKRRLAAVRRALLRADPASTTVTEVAVRYGFYHTGRFAGAYRAAFGESPSETLRH